MRHRSKSYKKSRGKSRRRRSSIGKSVKKVAKKLYKGAASLGTFETKMHTYAGYFIGFLLGLFALFLIMRNGKYSGKTTGTIKAINNENICKVKNPDPKNLSYSCSFNLFYTANGREQTKEFTNVTTTKQYADGQTLTIYFNPNQLDDISLSSDSSKTLGFVLLGVAIFIIFLSWFQYYKVKKFKFLAAEEGVNTIFKMFK
jgi:hypothetical protein